MKDLSGKKLLILSGAAVHKKLVEAAKELGVYTIVTDYVASSPAKMIADESWMISVTDTEELVKRCNQEKVDGVLNFCIDPAQIPYQKICKMLNLPCYGTEEQFFIMTNKNAFKQACKKAGIDTIPSYSLPDITAGNVEYPVIVKPSDSRGSRGQRVCNDMEETLAAVERAKKEASDGEVVIEKYMMGKQDFAVTYFVWNGNPFLIRVCDRFLGKKEDGLDKQCIAAFSPSRYSDWYLEKTDGRVKQFIREIGLQNGPLFMQGFIDGDTVRFYDPGLRFPGGEYELFLKHAVGVNLMYSMIELALTGQI